MQRTIHSFVTLNEIFDLLPDAVLVVDLDGRIIMHNRQALIFFGYSSNELLTKPVDVLIPERFRAQHAGHISKFFHQNESRKMAKGLRLFAVRKDHTEIQVDIALAPYQINSTPYTIAVVRELSDKHYLEQRIESLQRAKEELEQFAYVVSHDLKSPIKRIHMLVDLITRELPQTPNSDFGQLVAYLNQSIAVTEKLIHGILEQARIENEDHVEPLNLNEVLKEVRNGLEFPPHFTLHVEKELPVIRGNETQWLQIFLNLISNAIKYNDKNHGVLQISWETSDHHHTIGFSDNGSVVPEEKREMIFNLFQRAHQDLHGASHGIGLAIVKKIVEKAGGSIRYQESGLGGSEFIINWPV